jgi:hypothetical protein
MLCHAYADRVECHDGKVARIVESGYKGKNRIELLAALRKGLREYFEKRGVDHVAIDYQNLGMQAKNPNRQVGEVTGVIVAVALELGASVEKS